MIPGIFNNLIICFTFQKISLCYPWSPIGVLGVDHVIGHCKGVLKS